MTIIAKDGETEALFHDRRLSFTEYEKLREDGFEVARDPDSVTLKELKRCIRDRRQKRTVSLNDAL